MHVQPNDRIRCVAIIGYILSAYPSKIVIDHLNILLAPEVNKLLAYLSETTADQVGRKSSRRIIYFDCNF